MSAQVSTDIDTATKLASISFWTLSYFSTELTCLGDNEVKKILGQCPVVC